ncbi:hypothetical protein [Pseudoduganella sp.]|uniref:hypothetical protein n=1 Tax=Pseudoduganella sp. TaxID=1880898 RepID=UPI0035AF5F3F
MDNSARITKVEVEVDNVKRDIDRLYGAIDRLREHMDKGFSEVRREIAVNTRWLVGLTLANTAMILGLSGRLLGLY